MNQAQVDALRELLARTGWLERTRYFSRALRGRARTPHGLLVVGTPQDEPWHLTAHLTEESRLAGLPELEPVLVRWAAPVSAPPHLSVTVQRLEHLRRDETLLVVSGQAAPAPLLERIAGARRAGTAIFALDQGDPELDELAHECLPVLPGVAPVSFDGAQHLVSAAVGEAACDGPRRVAARPGPGLRSRLNRIIDAISGPAPD